jgi:uncharacterized protein (DUF58 family)
MVSLALIADRIRPGPRFERWILRRVRRLRGTQSLPFTLEYRLVYVLPTRFGVWFGLLLAITALGGLNFNNNMALLLGFVLAAVAQLTTLLAYRNIAGLTVGRICAAPVFAGETARFRVYLDNQEERHRFAVQITSASSADTRDMEPGQSRALVLQQASSERGWMVMAPFNIENRYPLGLFRAWSIVIPDAACLVYPRPAPSPPPLPRAGRGDSGAAQPGEGENFHGLREYRTGDPLRRVAWRASARHDRLYSRLTEISRNEACELDWKLLGGHDTEQRLSILTAWVMAAERQQLPYSLSLPDQSVARGLGDEHRDTCLQLLALYGK